MSSNRKSVSVNIRLSALTMSKNLVIHAWQVDKNLIKSTIIKLLDDHEPLTDRRADDGQIIDTSIGIGPKEVHLRISVLDQIARLPDIVPLAQAICNKLSKAVMDTLNSNNTPVSCQKGCSTCCNYLVTLSLPEIYYLQEMLSYMPEDYHRSVLQSCLEAAQKILRNNANKPEMTQTTELDLISRWYSELNLACPFLSDDTCEIYEDRPLACREHMVISNPKSCKNDSQADPDVVSPSVSVLEALGQLTAELEQSEIEAVILPLAFISTDDYFESSGHAWPAIDMVQRFVEIIQELATCRCEPATV